MKEILSFLNFDPKTQEGITNITIWLAMLVYFLFLNVFVVSIALPNQPENYTFYLFVLFVPAATKLIFFSGDSISFRTNREAAFFQSQFPDKYIASKYDIGLPRAQHLWFKCLDKRAEDGEIKRTFQYGYTCRLVYYTRRLARAFFLLSLVIILYSAVNIYLSRFHNACSILAIWNSVVLISNIKAKGFYMLHVGAIWIYLILANKPDPKKPTGVWARWKHINDRIKAWVDRFASLKQLEAFVYPTPPSTSDTASKPSTSPSH